MGLSVPYQMVAKESQEKFNHRKRRKSYMRSGIFTKTSIVRSMKECYKGLIVSVVGVVLGSISVIVSKVLVNASKSK